MKYLILLALIPVICIADECEEAKNSNYSELRNTEMFTSDAIGYVGQKPEWYIEYECILKEDNREMVFESILANSTVAGQLYALKGLKEIGSEKFVGNIAQYESDSKEVRTMFGCLVGNMKVSEIAGFIKSPEQDENANKPVK